MAQVVEPDLAHTARSDAALKECHKDLKSIGEPTSVVKMWFHVKLGELREEPSLLSEQDVMPDAPLVAVVGEDGVRRYRAFRVEPPGTFAALTSRVTARKSTPAIRPVELSAALMAKNPGTIVPIRRSVAVPLATADGPVGTGSSGRMPYYVEPGEDAAEGAEGALAKLHRAKAEVRLSTDGYDLVVSVPDGRPRAGVRECVEVYKPAIVAKLRGDYFPCTAHEHPENPPEGKKPLLGGAWSCE